MAISQRLYNQVMMADDFTCVYCGRRTPDLEVDHIIPQSVGGPDVIHNLVAACFECNRRKGDRQLHEVGMRLRCGRFAGRAAYPSRHRITTPGEEAMYPHVARPKITTKEWVTRIQELALERGVDGNYRFSANKIRDIVGGSDAIVKAQVRKHRHPTEN